MVEIDNERVFVFHRRVPVAMAMGLLPLFMTLAVLVAVLMVLVMDMQVFVFQRLVEMFHRTGIVGRP